MSGGGAANAATAVKTAYQGVIDDVIKGVRESFLNEGVDEQVLSDLKELWENKLDESGVINHPPPLIPKHKVTETPPKHGQQVWNVRQQQQQQVQQQSHSSPNIHHQQPRQQQQQHKRPQQQSSVAVTGSHDSHPVFTSVSNAPPPPANPVTSANTVASSTAQNTALLQSNIASTAAIANMIPNLQYMIPGVGTGQSTPGYTVVLDPQNGTPIMIPMATLASMQMAKQLQALQQQTAAAVARGSTATSTSTQQFSVIQNPALSMLAAAAAATSSDTTNTHQQSQSSQSTDSTQVDGTLPPLSDNVTTEDDCISTDSLSLHESFLRFQSKQLQSNIFTPDILNTKETFDDNPITAGSVLSKRKCVKTKGDAEIIPQLDGPNEESSEEEESEDSEEEDEGAGQAAAAGDDDPLNSGDDDSVKSDEEDKFETENIIVCQFDKVTRTRIGGKNRWKFHLKDGIMNLDGCDYVFQKATGEADW
ncbi:transcription initiation factor IIA subunit 1-like [Dysidea avara]|uniref:transcription initiation factor IIA subunit 1-like n=1 Tax=Dysidea avara TaxID=196820 RepID=UPI00331BEC68